MSRQMIFGSSLCASCNRLREKRLTGGAEGDRTPGLRIANAALCQTELLPHAENDTTVSSFRFQVWVARTSAGKYRDPGTEPRAVASRRHPPFRRVESTAFASEFR